MAFDYPNEGEIVDPRKALSRATAKLLEPCYSEGQWQLREWQSNPNRGEAEAIRILAGIAVRVLERVVQEALRKHADNFDAFREAIGSDGGAADLGMKYAHFIYKDVIRGRMLALWHNPIRDQIFDAITRAENEWWQNLRAKAAGHAPDESPTLRDAVGVAARRKAIVEPLLLTKGWSILDWAGEAKVDYNTASDYLNGLTNPHRRTLVRLGRALGIPVSELPH